MKLTELESIVQGGESHTLEFKKSTAQLSVGLETICAFLNNQGGTVLIGVTTKGEIIGQDVADKAKQSIAHELGKLEPPVQIDVHYVPLTRGKLVIVLRTKPGPHQPYVYDGRPYYREQSVTNRMPQQRYDQLVAARLPLNFAWDEVPAKGYSVRDLDRNLILGVVRKSVEVKRMPEEALRQSVPQILAALNLAVDDQLKNAAVVLFAKKTFSAYPQCQLKMARFKGTDRDEFLDSDLLYGNAFELLEKGLLFVRRHLPLSGRIESGRVERIEELLIPFKAVREALINALCHRDYSSRSGSIGLAIYDDRMEIFNDGGLPPGVTIEKIKAGFSKPRNSLIADVFSLYMTKTM